MTERPALSRRALLTSSVLAGSGLVAGCLGGDDGTAQGPTDGRAGDGPIVQTAIDGADLVVDLEEGHSVAGLTLVRPDGTSFASTDVATGATTVRLQLLEIEPGLGGYSHYEPGTYELVADHGEETTTVDVQLEPDLRIRSVEQYRNGDEAADYGKLAVTVENVGTGPTWVYDVTYQGAPNNSANAEIVSNAGVPQLDTPTSTENLILAPEDSQKFVGQTAPLILSGGSQKGCSSSVTFSVIVGVASGDQLRQRVTSQIGGEAKPVGLVDEYSCNNVDVEIDSLQTNTSRQVTEE